MTAISNCRRLSAVILVMFALLVLINSPVQAAQACPKGKVNCTDPCKQYKDANGNSICDLSESGTTNNSGNTNSNLPTASNSETASDTSTNSSQAGPAEKGRRHGGPLGQDVEKSANQSDADAVSNADVQGFFAANMGQNAIPILGGVIALILVGGVYLGRSKKKG